MPKHIRIKHGIPNVHQIRCTRAILNNILFTIWYSVINVSFYICFVITFIALIWLWLRLPTIFHWPSHRYSSLREKKTSFSSTQFAVVWTKFAKITSFGLTQIIKCNDVCLSVWVWTIHKDSIVLEWLRLAILVLMQIINEIKEGLYQPQYPNSSIYFYDRHRPISALNCLYYII